MFRLGYNTNGLPFQRLGDALELVSDLGYEAIAITPDVGALDPLRLSSAEVLETRTRLDDLGLAVAIETGARFVLDPRRKHRPTLLEASAEERRRRVDFYFRCLDLAAELGAGVVSLWAGAAPGVHTNRPGRKRGGVGRWHSAAATDKRKARHRDTTICTALRHANRVRL